MVKAVLPLFPACPVVDGMKVGKRTSGVWSAGSLVLRRCLCEVTQPVCSYSLVALQSERFCCRFVTKVKVPCWTGVMCWSCVLPNAWDSSEWRSLSAPPRSPPVFWQVPVLPARCSCLVSISSIQSNLRACASLSAKGSSRGNSCEQFRCMSWICLGTR